MLEVTEKERREEFLNGLGQHEQLLNSRLNEVYKRLDRLYGTLMTIPKDVRPHYLKKAYKTLSSFHSHAAIALLSSYGDSNEGENQKEERYEELLQLARDQMQIIEKTAEYIEKIQKKLEEI